MAGYLPLKDDFGRARVSPGGYQSIHAVSNKLIDTPRNFTTFDPVLQTYMTMQTAKTFAGDFEIEFTFSTTSTSSLIFIGDSHISTYYLNSDSTKFSAWVAGVEHIFLYNSLTPRDGKLHKVVYSLKGTQLTVRMDGQQVHVPRTITPYRGVNNFKIGVANSASAYFNGVIANVTLTDLTNPSNSESWKLDRPIGTNTEQSSSGNNLLTYVNATKRELFTKVGNDWLGAEKLTVTPDSYHVAQEQSSINADGVQGEHLISTMGGITGVQWSSASVVGYRYLASLEITESTSGAVKFLESANIFSTEGVYSEKYIATGLWLYVKRHTGVVNARINNVSLKRILEVA